MPVTSSRAQRDAIYEMVINHLTAIGELIESAQHRWRAVISAHLVAMVRAARSSRTASSSKDRRISKR